MFDIWPDKHFRPIREGDLVRLYHFTGARRKRHYMYKLVCLREGRIYAYDAVQAAFKLSRGQKVSTAHCCDLSCVPHDQIEILDGGESFFYQRDGEEYTDVDLLEDRPNIRAKVGAFQEATELERY